MIIWVLNPDELYLAKQHGYAVADNHVFIENGGSGKTLNRSGLREVRSLVQVSAIQALICLDPDRLAGNLGHLLLLEEETKKHGVQLLFVYLPREDSPEGKLMLSVRGAVAEYEREKILQRSRDGREARARKGFPMTHHCVPYGYRYNAHGMLEPEPTEAAVVRRIFALRLSGLGIMKIVRLLSAEGIPTRSDLGMSISPKSRGRGVWSPSTIHRMLRSTTYIGQMWWDKRHYEEERREVWNPREQWVAIPCPAIIDKQTWDAVQELLSTGKTYANAGRKHEYLFLNGRAKCGRCGYALSGFYETKRAARFYRCTLLPLQREQTPCINKVLAYRAGRYA